MVVSHLIKLYVMKHIATIAALMASLTATAQKPVKYTIQLSEPGQTVLHFGASDAWSMDKLGLWPKAQREQVADWLFSLDTTATGQPKGIGLSLWRFNLGAGSAGQGDSARIQPSTRTECVLQPDGTYDWSRQLGQRRFLRMARRRGVPYLLAFMNSVPVYFTQNALATNTGRGGTMNIRPDGYEPTARYVATALKGIEQRDSVRFSYVSPVNEPDASWNWQGPKQEGTPATNRETARLARAVSRELRRKGLTAQVAVNESSDLRCLLGTYHTDWTRANGLAALFCPDSTLSYVGNLPNVTRAILAHSYWTNTPVDTMRVMRQRLRQAARQWGVSYWQSEVCIMGNDEEIGGGGRFDFSMLTALYVARMMHYDLVYGNAASWSWWRAAGGDYKDGLLRVMSDNGWRSGRVLPSKLLWTMGNYSRFVRPGAVRFNVTASDAGGHDLPFADTQPRGVMISAYRNTDGSWAAVAVNYAEGERNIQLDFSDGSSRTWTMYRTSDAFDENLKPVGHARGEARLMPRSVTTFVTTPSNMTAKALK